MLLNPTVPILHEEGAMNDDYIAQLVASADWLDRTLGPDAEP